MESGDLLALLGDLEALPITLSGGIRFKQLVLLLVDEYAKGNGRRESVAAPEGQYSAYSDAIFPDGLGQDSFAPAVDDHRAPLPVKIVFFPAQGRGDESREIAAIAQRSHFEGKRQQASSVLLVHNLSDQEVFEYIGKVLQSSGPPPRMEVWNKTSLSDLLAVHHLQLGPDPFSLLLKRLNRLLIRTDAWQSHSKLVLQSLRDDVAQLGVSIFVGAGASIGTGLPGWNELIAQLYRRAFVNLLGDSSPAELARLVERISFQTQSPVQSARYLQAALNETNDTYAGVVSDALYQSSPLARSPLLTAIADLCEIINDEGQRIVKSVVTLNFDDLLEEELSDRSVDHRSIYSSPSASAVLQINHVHGFLPRSGLANQEAEDASMVFSESAYHRLYSDPYHWTNLIQLSALRETPCLMVGLSMTDPNLRRLLDIAARGQTAPTHYAFLKRDSLQIFREMGSCDESEIDLGLATRLLDAHHAVQEAVLERLGVRIIWFETFDEIPLAVESLRSSNTPT